MTFHDTPLGTPESLRREEEMRTLIRLLEEPLDEAERATVPAVVKNAMVETSFTPMAAERLKAMLSKLGNSGYDLAIKIIGDIGSATVKKLLGL
jgi:hypothetical protein